jgi:glycosyltransferase involved in cell wall biosynthesis
MADKIKKIIMVGPVYPYKGGISHYSGLLYKALYKRFDVRAVSFKLQYPEFLYPGGEQKDYKEDLLKIENAGYILNTVNPFSYIKTGFAIKKEKPDLVIFQWWHPFFSPAYYVINKIIKRKTKILFICHNVFPHEKFPLEKWLAGIVLNNGTHFIVNSGENEKNLLRLIKKPKYARCVHPTYEVFKLKNMSSVKARELTGIAQEDNVLLFFGFIREYKGLRHLIKAMPKIIKCVSNCKLLIVGDFYQNKDEYLRLIKENNVGENIFIIDEYISGNEVEKYFSASDAIVAPYESATQSGIIQIAYGFEKPVIATKVGDLPEVVLDGKTGYLVDACNPDELADAIIKFFKNNDAANFRENIKNEAHKYSWDGFVDTICSLIDFHTDGTPDI